VSPTTFQIPSFAKINWSLQVLGRRPDGYHEIRTLLQTISLHDDLRFSSSGGDELIFSCSDPNIPVGLDNLVVRAAHALRDRFQIGVGANIHLEKRIPAKGGLGGGSSNAAITLLALSKLWDLEIEQEDLFDLGGKLGADVPFFFTGGTALAEGTGTRVFPVTDAAKKHIVIISPNATVSTAAAYEALQASALTTSSDDTILSSFHAGADLELSRPCKPRNDFEHVVFESEPEIGRAKNELQRVGADSSLLAGSGSSVFGIFESKQEQERAIAELKAEPGWRVFPAVTMSRREYSQALGPCGVLVV
jgi:4-diphosphocytidyl-2-C-methyl-D-erythritol kinase